MTHESRSILSLLFAAAATTITTPQIVGGQSKDFSAN
jgi:hypothetical protein